MPHLYKDNNGDILIFDDGKNVDRESIELEIGNLERELEEHRDLLRQYDELTTVQDQHDEPQPEPQPDPTPEPQPEPTPEPEQPQPEQIVDVVPPAEQPPVDTEPPIVVVQ
jgi:hypothetical protein